MEQSGSYIPRHNVIDSRFDTESSIITAMCYGKKFLIKVQAKDLKDTVFLEQYTRLVESLRDEEDDVDEYEKMCDWMLVPCFPVFRDLAPRPPQHTKLTLTDFYHPPTHRVKLLVSKQRLIARGTTGRDLEGGVDLMIKSTDLPSFANVARVAASALTIVPDQSDDHWCEIPKKLCTEDGKQYHFKPVFDRSQHIREVETLSGLARTDLQDKFRISRLVGIVVSDNMQLTIGLLIEWIPSIGDLQSVEVRSRYTYHARWERQVRETVTELHKYGIIWGDVHPGNIVIDTEMNAWVIDFGGGWVEPFMTRKMCGTIEGDLQGITKVFEYLRDGDNFDCEGSEGDTERML